MVLPALSAAETLLAFLRGVFVASLLASFGAALFLAWLVPPGLRAGPAQRCRRVLQWSLIAAFPAGLAWLLAETHAIAGTAGLAQTFALTPTVLSGTSFGRVLALQGVALLASAAAFAFGRRGAKPAALFAGIAVLLEAGHSHAFARADGMSLLLASQGVHLLAAGAWLGGLLPLLVLVRTAPLDEAQRIVRRFSALGVMAVTLLILTAAFQAFSLAGGLAGLTGTPYGSILLAKAALFAVLLALAVLNRAYLTAALTGARGEPSRKALARSIEAETVLGLCIVLAAALLSSLEPGVQ